MEALLDHSREDCDSVQVTTGFENKHAAGAVDYTPYTNVLPVGDAAFNPENPVAVFNPPWASLTHIRLYSSVRKYDPSRLNTILSGSPVIGRADEYHPSFEEPAMTGSSWLEFPFAWYDVKDDTLDSLVKVTLYPDVASSKYSVQNGIVTKKA